MRNIGVMSLAFMLFFSTSGYSQENYDRCRSISSDMDRLACFDGKTNHPVNSSNYRKMSLIDFKTDKATLRGVAIETEGLIMPFADRALLMVEVGDMSGVLVDISSAPREDRRALAACSNACSAKVQGIGSKAMLQDGIRADRIFVK